MSFASYALWNDGVDNMAGNFDDMLIGGAPLGALGTLSLAVPAGGYFYKATGNAIAPGASCSLASAITPVPHPKPTR